MSIHKSPINPCSMPQVPTTYPEFVQWLVEEIQSRWGGRMAKPHLRDEMEMWIHTAMGIFIEVANTPLLLDIDQVYDSHWYDFGPTPEILIHPEGESLTIMVIVEPSDDGGSCNFGFDIAYRDNHGMRRGVTRRLILSHPKAPQIRYEAYPRYGVFPVKTGASVAPVDIRQPFENEWLPFNINNHVKVRLSTRGESDYRTFYTNLGIPAPPIKTDSEGYSVWSMWELMNIWGNSVYMGNPNLPFETTILLENKDK